MESLIREINSLDLTSEEHMSLIASNVDKMTVEDILLLYNAYDLLEKQAMFLSQTLRDIKIEIQAASIAFKKIR